MKTPVDFFLHLFNPVKNKRELLKMKNNKNIFDSCSFDLHEKKFEKAFYVLKEDSTIKESLLKQEE